MVHCSSVGLRSHCTSWVHNLSPISAWRNPVHPSKGTSVAFPDSPAECSIALRTEHFYGPDTTFHLISFRGVCVAVLSP